MVLTQGSVKTDWEVELGIVIGTQARYVTEAPSLTLWLDVNGQRRQPGTQR